ncbi:MAG: MotA/TolQ/ExbB proton channel family protein [Paraclostridium sp.]
MSNILINLIISIFTNPITILFIGVTVLYTVLKVLKTNLIYNFIKEKLTELNLKQEESSILALADNKYEFYKQNHPYSEINMNTFIEEVTSDLTINGKNVIDEIKSIKNTPSLCILLGVLGTFVGLTITLASIDKSDIVNSMTMAISSMQIAFATSIVGIICSILVNAYIKHKNCEHLLLQLMLKLENLMTAKSTHNKGEVLDDKLSEIKSCIREITRAISAIERFDKISKDLNDFNDEFITSIGKLGNMLNGSNESIKSFDQSLRKLDKQFNILNLKFVKLFDTYEANNEIYKGVADSIKESTISMKSSSQSQSDVKNYLRDINAGFAIYERNIQDLMTKLISHENKVLLRQQDIKDTETNLNNDIIRLTNTIDEQGKSMVNQLELVFKYIDIYKDAMEISNNTYSTREIPYINTNQTYELDEELDEEEFEYDK